MGLRRVALVAPAVVALVACGLHVTGAAPSGGTSNDASPEGTTTGPEGSAGDDETDAMIGVDSGPGDGAAFCSSTPPGTVFCSDFEDASPPKFGWGDLYIAPDASTPSLTVVPSPMRAEGHALRIELPASGGNAASTAELITFLPSVSGFNIQETSFDVFLESTQFDFAEIGAVWFTNNVQALANGVAAYKGGQLLSYGGGAVLASKPAGSWHRAMLQHTKATTFQLNLLASLDGTAIHSEQYNVSSYYESDFRVGGYLGSPAAGTLVAYVTNVLITRK